MAENPLHMQPKPKIRRGPGRPFAKGQSGNPAGKAPGTKNRATLLAEQFLDGEAAALTRKAVEMALRGDAAAMRLCLERVIAPRRERPVQLALPAVRNAADLGDAMASVAAAASQGTITPSEACELSQVLETYIRAVASGDFARRLQLLEEAARPGREEAPHAGGI